MKDRPKRSKKSTRLNDFWYPTKKRKESRKKDLASLENGNDQSSPKNLPELRSPSPEVRLEDQNLRAHRSLTPETAQDPKTQTVKSKTPKELLEELFLGSRLGSKLRTRIYKLLSVVFSFLYFSTFGLIHGGTLTVPKPKISSILWWSNPEISPRKCLTQPA